MLSLLAPLAVRFVTVTAHNAARHAGRTLAEHIRATAAGRKLQLPLRRVWPVRRNWAAKARVCALGTLYFSGDVRKAFARLNA